MVVGFNHNFLYKGEVYHIQTEDSGRNSPNIVTLLYRGGTILASKKTSYADILKVNNLEQVVEELMKEQHKGMLRGLKAGEYDEVIARFDAARAGQKATAVPPPAAAPRAAEPAAAPLAPPPPPAEAAKPAAVAPPPRPAETAKPATAAPPPPPATPPAARKSGAVEQSLDEIILSYLMGEGD